ncbi:MAG: hypothetical protein A2Z37_07665 [Chloroflexi bacterium RBG_19FT_COMBO_62_14]|nr:MAG: hypothetical protein A2Z37_07665 [Chloroflexi bacterium RBG_19FT_COMBO_62_14]
MEASRGFWRLIRIGPRLAYALGLGPLIGRFVLLLTTTGRTSGKPRITPLVYEEEDGNFNVASARGPSADWLHNIRANPNVAVRVGDRRLAGRAEIVTDLRLIAGYLQHLKDRNPRMFGAVFRLEGLSPSPTLEDLEELARRRPMVTIRTSDH